MDYASVNAYLEKLRRAAAYKELAPDDREAEVFEATELLKDNFAADKITDRAVALQVLFTLEGDEDEFNKLKRQGVKSYAVKGVSVSFEGSGISPDVINLLSPNVAAIGRWQ